MYKILLIISLSLLLEARSYPQFTDNDFSKIKKAHAIITKNRFLHYKKQVKLFKTYSKEKQLNHVNRYLNQLLPQYDSIIHQKEDYWATPKEFLFTGYGDCEDYVIIKYFTLLELGFDKEKLYLTTVYEKYTGAYHMVLTYFKEKNKSPLVLDNLSFRILDLKIRIDIQSDLFINHKGIFKITKTNQLEKIAQESSKYILLSQKVKQGL